MRKKYICISDTIYSLSLYLLLMDLNQIVDSKFFLGDAISEKIKEKLPNVSSIHTKSWNWKIAFVLRLKMLYFYLRHPHCIVYAQDHISYADVLIENNKYTLLEDAPGVYGRLNSLSFLKPFTPNKGQTMKQKIKFILSHSLLFGKTFGTNEQCISRLVTDPKDIQSPYIKGKKYELISLSELWKIASEEKKKYILDVFSISKENLIDSFNGDLLIITQPFMEDCNLSESEMVEIYKPYIDQFENVVIKIHPRDHFNYIKYFPRAKIMQTIAPMQLLTAIGVNFSTALTVFSSALSSMPPTTICIYLGTKVNPKIYEVCGDINN